MKLYQALLFLVVSSITALAQQPHFLSASYTQSGGTVVVTFSEAGLGDIDRVNYLLSTTWDVTFQCRNEGGHAPPADNKHTSSVATSTGQQFGVTNGRVNGQITASAPTSPPPPGDFQCPKGFRPVEVTAVLTSINLADTTNGKSITPSAA
jgi:hypothetical protein